MAWILTGADGRRWSAADWIVRNAFELMLPTLRAAAPPVAAACAAVAQERVRTLDLGPLLEDERNAAAWRFAVRRAAELARAESDASWYVPHARAAFAGAVEALETLVRPDGNELIAELAGTFGIHDQKVFAGPL